MFPTNEKELTKDIEFHFEKFMGTHIGKVCKEQNYQVTTAIEFTKYYINEYRRRKSK